MQSILETAKSDIKAAQSALEVALKDKASGEEVAQLKSTIEKLQGDKSSLEAKFTELSTAFDGLKGGGGNEMSFKSQVDKFIADNASEIEKLYKSKSGVIEFDVKAVGSITTASGLNLDPPSITGVQQAPLQNVNLRAMQILGLTTTLSTSLTAYPYTEAEPKEGGYDFVAEGGLKSQIDFKWGTRYATPKKVAAYQRLTEESIKDVVGLQSVANDYLTKQHALKKGKAILFGDGIGVNPKGASEYARAFVAGSMAAAVVNPTFMDVVNAVITDIATTHNFVDEVPYMANIVVIHPKDFFIHLVAAKDNEGRPLYPTASLFNMVNIGGVTIIPEESVSVGHILVADMSKYNTTNYVPFSIRIGWVNDDFIRNQFVMVGESRFHAFVKKFDEQAFVYDEISTIKQAITAPA